MPALVSCGRLTAANGLVQNQGTLLAMVFCLFPPLIKGVAGESFARAQLADAISHAAGGAAPSGALRPDGDAGAGVWLDPRSPATARATHVLANIAVPSTLRLVAQTRQRLLEAARPYTVDRVAAEEAEAERLRQATADLPDVDRLAHRVAHLRAIVAWADALQHDLGPLPASPDKERTHFEAALALAHRILADRDDPDKGDQVRSVVDPDARCGKHGAYFDGYLLDISLDADSEQLTALNLLPGNGDEARDAQTLLAAEERAQDNDVEAVSMDGMAGTGGLRALRAPEGMGVEVFVPPPPEPTETPLFRPEACVLDAQRGRNVSRGPTDGHEGAQCQRHRVEVGLCPPPVCRVCPARVVLGDAAAEEGARGQGGFTGKARHAQKGLLDMH